MPIWFSGSKGYHVAVELAHEPPPAVGFPLVAREFAEQLARPAGVVIDTSIYDIAHIIRLPNTRHPGSGLFKRLIDADALFRLDVGGVRRHAEHPAADGIPTLPSVPTELPDDWRSARTGDRGGRRPRRVPGRRRRPGAYFVEFFRFGVDPGERHRTCSAAPPGWPNRGAAPLALRAMLTEAGEDNGLAPRDVARQIRCGIDHAVTATRGRPTRDRTPPRTRDGFEAWAVRHEGDPLPPGALAFPFGEERECRVTPTFTTGADLFGSWLADVESGTKPVRFALPEPFAGLDMHAGRVLMFGSTSGSGKTAALMQLGTDLLRLNDTARLLVTNVEMAPALLGERIVSRLSGVPLTALADRTLTADQRGRVPPPWGRCSPSPPGWRSCSPPSPWSTSPPPAPRSGRTC